VACLERDPKAGAVVAMQRGTGEKIDITDEASVAQAAARLVCRHQTVDLIFNAAGALTIDGIGPEKTIRSISADAMARQFAFNSIGPALLLNYFVPLMPKDRRSLFASLSARVGSIGDNRLGGWLSYRASKAAQNQIIKTAAIELKRTHPHAVVAALHAGTVATALSEPYTKGHVRQTPDQSARQLLETLDGLSPEQSGGFYAYDGTGIEW
jgi:NAD(P)-dependent dehydrogenase (short-subunit alcohol dehydrogenase family)